MELPFDPAIPLLGLYPKNPETPIQKNLCTPMFIAAQFIISKGWKQPKCPSVNEWIEKLWYIYTKGFYAAERKKELLTCYDSRDGTGELLEAVLCGVGPAPTWKASGKRGAAHRTHTHG